MDLPCNFCSNTWIGPQGQADLTYNSRNSGMLFNPNLAMNSNDIAPFYGAAGKNKVMTKTGPRDRRVRLKPGTAEKLFHLQDLLGLRHPTQAVEWLLHICYTYNLHYLPLNTVPSTSISTNKKTMKCGRSKGKAKKGDGRKRRCMQAKEPECLEQPFSMSKPPSQGETEDASLSMESLLKCYGYEGIASEPLDLHDINLFSDIDEDFHSINLCQGGCYEETYDMDSLGFGSLW